MFMMRSHRQFNNKIYKYSTTHCQPPGDEYAWLLMGDQMKIKSLYIDVSQFPIRENFVPFQMCLNKSFIGIVLFFQQGQF